MFNLLNPRQLFTFAGILMVNMCLSGVVPALFDGVLSFCYTTEQLFNIPYVCIATAIIANTNQLVTFTSIAAMSVDRLVAVSIPLRYEQVVTIVKILVFIAIQVSLDFHKYCVLFLVTFQRAFENSMFLFQFCSYSFSHFNSYMVRHFIHL